MAYRDQFGYANFIEGKIKHSFKYTADKQWVAEATAIKKQAEIEKKSAVVTYGGPYNQGSFFNGQNTIPFSTRYYPNGQTTSKDIAEKVIKASTSEGLTDADQEKVTEIYQKWEANELSDEQFIAECKKVCPEMDPYWFIDSMGMGFTQ